MGLMKFMARKGAVGGTARTVAKRYKHYRNIHPNKEEMKDKTIWRLIIMDRYEVIKIPKMRVDWLMAAASERMNGLKDLVIGILDIIMSSGRITTKFSFLFISFDAHNTACPSPLGSL